ncbi:unnamed protein product, partial [Linum tenue]
SQSNNRSLGRTSEVSRMAERCAAEVNSPHVFTLKSN